MENNPFHPPRADTPNPVFNNLLLGMVGLFIVHQFLWSAMRRNQQQRTAFNKAIAESAIARSQAQEFADRAAGVGGHLRSTLIKLEDATVEIAELREELFEEAPPYGQWGDDG